MKIGKDNFHFRQGKGKMCSVNSERLTCLANLFFGFGTTFKSCPVLEKIGEVRMETGTFCDHIAHVRKLRHKRVIEYNYKGMLLKLQRDLQWFETRL